MPRNAPANRPRRSRSRRAATVPYLNPKEHFGKKLVLNQWLLGRFGIDVFADRFLRPGASQPIHVLAQSLREVPPGLNAAQQHRFLDALLAHWQPTWAYSDAELRGFDRNIVAHTQAINARRARPVEWKCFQWLSLLFVEIYLYEYFRDRQALQDGLNAQFAWLTEHYARQGKEVGLSRYAPEDLNKLCLQNATGSGKTLLMHVNIHQFRHYARQAGRADDYSQIILVSPNERLSEQHQRELRESDLHSERLMQDAGLLAAGRKALSTLAVTEITKLGLTQGDKRMAVDSFGDANLLLVDEGHRGLGSASEEKGWLAMRDKLAGRGFTFEYSATFKEAVVAAGDRAVEATYAKSIVFDYGYRYFYEDGFGKDYRIFNLPGGDQQQASYSYLMAALLAFYQQLRLYADGRARFKPYNLMRPLWVFVGASVVKDDGSKVAAAQYRDNASDVARILRFLAEVLADPGRATASIRELLQGSGQQTGLLSDSGEDIFAGAYPYLAELKLSPQALFRDLLRHVFQADTANRLVVERITGDSGELLLQVDGAPKPFGLINVGDAVGLADHLAETLGEAVDVRKTEFAQAAFAQVHLETSPVNVLIGSKKFVEGWDCWRVSSMGLMNTGKREGSQIIQLFGRGVRLKGRDNSLMRSTRYHPVQPPKHLHLLETLNVFGVGADFMASFRDWLKEEGLPGNEQTVTEILKLNVVRDLGKKLKMLRPKVRPDTHQAYSFPADGPRIRFGRDDAGGLGLPPEVLTGRLIVVDRRPKLEVEQSGELAERRGDYQAAAEPGETFDAARLSFLDWDRLYLDLDAFIRGRGYTNLLVQPERLRVLLLSRDWYRLHLPAREWQLALANRSLWQAVALEALSQLAERVYNHHRRAYLEPRLELVPLEQAGGNLPDDDHYQLIADGSQSALIDDIRQLKRAFEEQGHDRFDPGRESVRGLRVGLHLYNPVLEARSDRIKILPVALNDSEFQFVADIKAWWEAHRGDLEAEGVQLYLLRNLVRHGIGFFEAGGFWPDFILWCVRGAHQRITFIDPHGLTHEGPGSTKVEFAHRIKDVERRLNDGNVALESVILAPPGSLRASVRNRWRVDDPWLADRHVLFMSDGAAAYVSTLMGLAAQ
jgi:hypothetical protein